MHTYPSTALLLHLHTVHIIATLTLVMLLIWHISTTYLVERFGMPDVWKRLFKRSVMGEWRVGIWGGVFAVVACDLGYALACLEKVHARRSDAMLARRDYDSYYAATTTSLLHHMPIHVAAMAVYAAHMASFATGLGPSADTCQANVLEAEWQLRRMQHPEQRLPLTERCVRIQWSIWLAGGFSVAAAFLVIMIHALTLAARICGVVWERGGGAREESEEDGGGGGGGAGSEALEAGGGEASERVGRGQEAVKGKADWTEAFLECLLP